ncbi:MAG: hypothetical protein JSW41_04670 [Candidatus Aenigmatarchaeota archaeon]|nr:MAG: hypothetical protein JSW41_04670 [Candidatus Aenigmarchaeota archaeon]
MEDFGYSKTKGETEPMTEETNKVIEQLENGTYLLPSGLMARYEDHWFRKDSYIELINNPFDGGVYKPVELSEEDIKELQKLNTVMTLNKTKRDGEKAANLLDNISESLQEEK